MHALTFDMLSVSPRRRIINRNDHVAMNHEAALRPHAGRNSARGSRSQMKTLLKIQHPLAAGEFEFSRHALRRVVERNIREQEIREAGAKAEVIEDYPHDKYSPRALLLGFTVVGRPLHFQVSYADSRFNEDHRDL